MTPQELERRSDNLQDIIADLMRRSERVKARLTAAAAALSQHQHDYTRDVTGKPTTFTPSTHTHAYASSTHVHDYQDWRTADYHDESRTTGGPV